MIYNLVSSTAYLPFFNLVHRSSRITETPDFVILVTLYGPFQRVSSFLPPSLMTANRLNNTRSLVSGPPLPVSSLTPSSSLQLADSPILPVPVPSQNNLHYHSRQQVATQTFWHFFAKF